MMGDQIAFALLVHFVFGVIAATMAVKWKGRSPIMWFIIGFFLSILGLIILAFFPKIEPKQAQVSA